MSYKLASIHLHFEHGQVIILDDRAGNSGDIFLTLKFEGKTHTWTVNDLTKVKNMVAPKKYDENTGKPYNPMPANMWEATRKAIAIFT